MSIRKVKDDELLNLAQEEIKKLRLEKIDLEEQVQRANWQISQYNDELTKLKAWKED